MYALLYVISSLAPVRLPRASRRDRQTFRRNHLSNTTRLTCVFFKSGDKCSGLK